MKIEHGSKKPEVYYPPSWEALKQGSYSGILFRDNAGRIAIFINTEFRRKETGCNGRDNRYQYGWWVIFSEQAPAPYVYTTPSLPRIKWEYESDEYIRTYQPVPIPRNQSITLTQDRKVGL